MLYDKVKRLCDENNISVNQLEIKLGLGNGTVSKWKKSLPNVTNLFKVADYFNMSVYELKSEEDADEEQ